MEEFHFLRPEWLWGFVPLGGILLMLVRTSPTFQIWTSVCDAHLLPHLLMGKEGSPRRWPEMILGLAGTLALLALAGPVWSQLPQPVFRAESALVIVLDTSRSMDAQDVAPSRLTRAKQKIFDILNLRQEGQTGLVVFAGDSFVVSPLTDDAKTMVTLIQSLETHLMPSQGSRPDLGLDRANELLQGAGIAGGTILLVTDGEGDEASLEVTKALRAKGRTISVLGVGTEHGAPIPASEGFVKASDGSIVLPRLQPSTLKAMAREGGGYYETIRVDDRDLHRLLPSTPVNAVSGQEQNHQRTTPMWREEGPWLVLALLVIVLPAFRPGWLGLVVLGLLIPQVSEAFSWDNAWSRPDQQGMQALERQAPEEAARLFQDPSWKGIAHYRAGDFEQAEQTFADLKTPQAQYNRGNALAKLGRYQEALASYQSTLTQQPDHTDARHNAQLIKKLLEQQSSLSKDAANSSFDSPTSQDQQGKNGEGNTQNQEMGTQEQNKVSNPTASQPDDGKNSKPQNGMDSHKPQESPSRSDDQMAAKDDEENTLSPSQGLQEKEQHDGDSGSSADQEQSDDGSGFKSSSLASRSDSSVEEQASEQALQQWLRRIPDDPGGLLRRKFLLEHRRRIEAGTAVDHQGRDW